ncbi:zinc finger protein Noc-like isoform X1 [Uloborus diversus]|uniref:zinc finger protein Noc-like isoform X1 n=1 Tax=Uloborus diversus TaxID=327109 RepID=UPI00240A9BF1|nr:zinc finger protein Noc-like isoform X1 [Uloborus diversus]
MLTSGNQYLRPEYLSPLPTTLDAKKSPLALLAQTCSNIGADNPNHKPIISGLEKSKDNDSKKDKSPVVISDELSNSKPSFKPYESVIKKEDISSEINGKKTPNSKRNSPSVVNQNSPAISTGSCGKSSPTTSDNGRNSAHNVNKSDIGVSRSLTSPCTSSVTSTTLCSSQNTLSGLGYGSSSGLSLDLARSDPIKEGLSHLGLNAYKALNGLNPLSNCTGCPMPGHPMDAYQSSAQSNLLKAGTYPLGASALSPYVGYARVKTATGGTTLVPVCRDANCTNCQFSMYSAQRGPCPSGCTQCTHDRLGTSLSGLSHGLVPGLTGSAAAMAAVAAAGGMPGLSYPHSMMARPNVCSWVVGDNLCGKIFNSAEELLQHAKTHTSLSDSVLPLISPAFSSASLSAACHMHYSSAASLTSPAGLRRTYPTSLSPVSSLSAASRYHPYKPPFSGLPGAPLPPLGHPSLGMYYPYGLYGQRLGPPVHP